jgi:hypothetical protein
VADAVRKGLSSAARVPRDVVDSVIKRDESSKG